MNVDVYLTKLRVALVEWRTGTMCTHMDLCMGRGVGGHVCTRKTCKASSEVLALTFQI